MARREEADRRRGPPAGRSTSKSATLLESEPFRLLVAPAIFLVKGFGLVVLLGIVPALVIPLLDGDPQADRRAAAMAGRRLPGRRGRGRAVLLDDRLARPGRRLGSASRSGSSPHCAAGMRGRPCARGLAGRRRGCRPGGSGRLAPFLAWFFPCTRRSTCYCRGTSRPDGSTFRSGTWPGAAGGLPGPARMVANFPWLPLVVFALKAGVWPARSSPAACRLREPHCGRSPLAAAYRLGCSRGLLHLLRADWLHRLAVVTAAA